jgi:hypothetical protein
VVKKVGVVTAAFFNHGAHGELLEGHGGLQKLGLTTARHAEVAWGAQFPQAVAVLRGPPFSSVRSVVKKASDLREMPPAQAS